MEYLGAIQMWVYLQYGKYGIKVYPMMLFLLICTCACVLHARLFLEGYKIMQETGNRGTRWLAIGIEGKFFSEYSKCILTSDLLFIMWKTYRKVLCLFFCGVVFFLSIYDFNEIREHACLTLIYLVSRIENLYSPSINICWFNKYTFWKIITSFKSNLFQLFSVLLEMVANDLDNF